MKKQKVIRTYPYGKFDHPTDTLQAQLNDGYVVVMANEFDICSDYNGRPYNPSIKGIEYIIEKEVSDE